MKAVFSNLYENDVINHNYLQKIKIEKTNTQRFKSYSHEQAIEILKYLERKEPVMALFVQFIGLNLLRPKEICRLRVRYINVKDKLLSVFVKQETYKTKRIPDDIIVKLSKLNFSRKDRLIFTKDHFCGKWDRELTGRRNY